jgi:hypothetical protein
VASNTAESVGILVLDLSGKDATPPGAVFGVGKLIVIRLSLLTEGNKLRSGTKKTTKEVFPGEVIEILSANFLKEPLDNYKA